MKRREEDEAGQRWARGTLAGDETRGGLGPRDGEAGSPDGWPSVWRALELPKAPAVPAGFSRRVARAWTTERARAAEPILGAAWMRAAAAAALLAGVALGGSLSYGTGTAAGEAGLTEEDAWWTASLSEEYLQALSASEPAGAEVDGQEESRP